jgi:hypothetical protein
MDWKDIVHELGPRVCSLSRAFRLTRCVRASALRRGVIFAVSLRNVIRFVLGEDAALPSQRVY